HPELPPLPIGGDSPLHRHTPVFSTFTTSAVTVNFTLSKSLQPFSKTRTHDNQYCFDVSAFCESCSLSIWSFSFRNNVMMSSVSEPPSARTTTASVGPHFSGCVVTTTTCGPSPGVRLNCRQ